MNAEQKLMPCPFCGNDVQNDEGCFQVGGFKPASTPVYAVRCGNPRCNADVRASSRDEAVAAWNTRALQQRPSEDEVEAIRVLDLLRTGKDGRKFDCIESRAGTMVNVVAFFSEAD